MKGKPTKFTFKTEKSTGSFRSFYPDTHYIKLEGKEVGSISDRFGHKIYLMVKVEPTKEKPAPFKNITLKGEFNSLVEAKTFLNSNFDAIINTFNLYQID